MGGMGARGVAPVGIPALPIPEIFKNTYDNNGSSLNQSGLTKYLNSAPFDVSVPERVGNQIVWTPLNVLATRANAIYQRLARSDATLSAQDINTLVSFDAGIVYAYFAQGGMPIDWNTALLMAKQRIVSTLRANLAYQARQFHYQRVLDDWEQAFDQQQRQRQQQGQQSTQVQQPVRGQLPVQNQQPQSQISPSGMWMGRGE
jgi:hypothetical protein